ncbi:MAG: hypothetical protein U0359_24935 [Byssovorax sp.]
MLGGFISGGCGGVSVSSICDEICACESCTSNDRADCEKAGGEAEKQASDAGCGSEFDDFLSCVKDNVHCKSGHTTFDGCNTQLSALDACSKGTPNPLLNPCDIATNHLVDCLDVTPGSGGGPIDCSGQNACVSGCINAASCDEIKDAFGGSPTDKSKTFLDCVTACSNSSSSSSSGGSSMGSSSGG